MTTEQNTRTAHTPGPMERAILMPEYNRGIESVLEAARKYDTERAALLAALEAIGGMVVDDDTDYRQLAAICIATAHTAIAQARGEA